MWFVENSSSTGKYKGEKNEKQPNNWGDNHWYILLDIISPLSIHEDTTYNKLFI